MSDWVVESPSFEEQLMNNRIVYLNQKGINEVVELIKNKDKEIERLNNIIKPQEVNYNYLKLLFEKKDKEEVIKSYVYKCEQLEKLYKSYEEKEIEATKKDNVISKAIEMLEKYEVHYRPGELLMKDMLLDILKGSEDNENL